MNERQRFPFVVACIATAIVVGFSLLTTHLIDPAPKAANETYWYLERSAGFTSYGLLSIAVLLGASSSLSFWERWNMRKLMTQMHQYASLLVFPFLFFHLWGLYMDKSVSFGIIQLLIPLTTRYRAIPTALGILTLYAWLTLIVTSYFREKIGVKIWRAIHILSFPMFFAVTFHGLFSGTDSNKLWAVLIYVVPTVIFTILCLKRIRKSTITTSKNHVPKHANQRTQEHVR
ncbi:ferric reductase-like transmembrane domain-containing protein (plasmid) [Alicyclobacillus fastidiosus]|uniref:Ferric reductase-like transmembrane domain-containing protein n=2 Tax=Alicyclobacillus fastidiosus TaxID=392011 RepID=A0ABY6ZPP9_9BACL|nr:ferric reductase-like transmembrane domain-containing protein [Alicyclobacillus fastidiosus]WAH44948.1 ferric reductase-like transmembrane domain-containing protein [Alicyclobacillus fastidiosus]